MGMRRRWRAGIRACERWLDSTPLWPAGHLPHLGGDRLSPLISPIANVAGMSGTPKLQSPPSGGDVRQAKGGAVEHHGLQAAFSTTSAVSRTASSRCMAHLPRFQEAPHEHRRVRPRQH
ncbi:MAG: hypothetical protein EOS09_18485 [Mesorhizobium sp.]|nr:MAG: hypothetical protein EOS09_18485 [Mesorhizobium sp.]